MCLVHVVEDVNDHLLSLLFVAQMLCELLGNGLGRWLALNEALFAFFGLGSSLSEHLCHLLDSLLCSLNLGGRIYDMYRAEACVS